MGICNFFARTLAMMAPLISELNPPYPMIILEAFLILAFLSTIFLRVKKKPTEPKNEDKILAIADSTIE